MSEIKSHGFVVQEMCSVENYHWKLVIQKEEMIYGIYFIVKRYFFYFPIVLLIIIISQSSFAKS